MSIAFLELGKSSSAESTIRKLYQKEPDDPIVSLHMAGRLQIFKKISRQKKFFKRPGRRNSISRSITPPMVMFLKTR